MGPQTELPGKFTFYVNGYPGRFYHIDRILDFDQWSVSEVTDPCACVTYDTKIVENNIRSGKWIICGTLANTEPEISVPNLEDVL